MGASGSGNVGAAESGNVGAAESGNVGAAESVEDLRIVMVGRTGNGKSATGNTILGREAFISKIQFRSVTTRCQKATGILPDGRTLAVIDTPGFFSPKYSQSKTIEEAKKCVSFCAPGPHVIIHVLRLGYFSQEARKVANLIKHVFSLEAKAYLIVLFTRKEELEGRSLQEVLSEGGDTLEPLRELMESCGNQCLAFNNKAKGKERQDQVDELIRMVDDLKRKNWVKPYYPKEMLAEDIKKSSFLGILFEEMLLQELSFLRSSPWKSPRRSTEEHLSNIGAAESVEDLRIVVVGKTGNGKSATGNTILGRKAFISKMQSTSVTARCEKAMGILPDGRTLAVIDTPGFFDTKYSQPETIEEVKKCVSFCSPGPHVIIQVICLGRFSQEEMEVAKLIKDIFSLKAKEYMVLLFTRKEDLDGRPLQEMLSEDGKSLAALREQIKSCGNRCLAFNNNAEGKERQDQVDELIQMVEDLARKNWPKHYYTKEMLEEDEKKAPGWLCTLL